MNNSKAWWALAVFVLICAVWSANAKSETRLYLGAWSEHLISGESYNEQHDLVAIEHNDWIAGRFVNSYYRETWFVAHKWTWKAGDVEAGVIAGAMRGYTTCWGDDGSGSNVCPMAAPYITVNAGPVSPTVLLLGEALAISARIEF